ncbi:hypothetical protein BC830DRAFT_933959 [Chytriomyces sp. MP71]|nr:hypothetical protein BC830DRAFT_933959 [Chytriomyces sp. MP71]
MITPLTALDPRTPRTVRNIRLAQDCGLPQYRVASICFLGLFMDLMADIKEAYELPPASIASLLVSNDFDRLRQKLDQVLDLLLSLSSIELNWSNLDKMYPSVSDLICVNLYHHASICTLHRPHLWLTGYCPLDSPHLRDNSAGITTILTALVQSLSSARSILEINSWIYHHQAYPLVFLPKLWKDYCSMVFALFEGCVVTWFCLTKTRSYWYTDDHTAATAATAATVAAENTSVLNLTLAHRRAFRVGLVDAVRTLRDLDYTSTRRDGIPNMVTPLYTYANAMLEEVQRVEEVLSSSGRGPVQDRGPIVRRRGREDSDVAGLVAGMDGLCLYDGQDGDTEREAWVFLSLLGCPVGVGAEEMYWRSANTHLWREFWNTMK